MQKGLNGNWINVFKTGKHTDSRGKEREWSTDDLDEIVNKYDPSFHEAPLCVGHPKDNRPAFGWAETLKREGTKLYAKLKQVPVEFEDAWKSGRYKKISVSISPKYGLRHIGVLGAQPPAVKGLETFSFSDKDDDAMVIDAIDIDKYEFSDAKKEESSMKTEELEKKIQQLEKDNADFAEKVKAKDAEITSLKEENSTLKKDTSEFSEQQTQLKTVTEELGVVKQQLKTKDNADFCEGLIDAGKLLPAEKETTMEFMSDLNDDQLKKYQDSLEKRPAVVEFGEQYQGAKKEKKGFVPTGSNVDQEYADLDQKAMEYQEKHPEVDYETALDKVLEAN